MTRFSFWEIIRNWMYEKCAEISSNTLALQKARVRKKEREMEERERQLK